MVKTAREALEVMLAHHEALSDGVAERVTTVREAVQSGAGSAAPTAVLIAYLADQVLPHAVAEEKSVYRAAVARAELEQPVATMINEHRVLGDAVERLASTDSGEETLELASAIGALFTVHVQKENEMILPLLAVDPSVDLPALVEEMHRLTGEEKRDSVAAGPASEDIVVRLTSLLTEAASGLADAGQRDRACRLVAEAWAVLRQPRPALAVRLTAKLHRLVSSADSQPVELTSGPRPAGGADDADGELDVRSFAPAQRHEQIFAAYAALAAGAGFVLVNDHDPKPLRYQFAAEHAGAFTWDALEEGPIVWRVRIGRPAANGQDATDESALDVRRIPHGQRHDIIFSTYQELGPGSGFVLVNDHDPVPLRYQFEAQYPGYTWEYLEAGPSLWRVRIGRLAPTGN